MLKCGAIVVTCLMWPACGIRKVSREDDEGSSRGLLSPRIRCDEGATVYMHGDYWAKKTGSPYFSKNKTYHKVDEGEKWKIKGYPHRRRDGQDRQYAFWSDRWNGWLSSGKVHPHVGEGEKFTIVETKKQYKYALHSDYWKGYMDPWGPLSHIGEGEIWKIWNIGEDKRACDEIPSQVTGFWLPNRNLYTYKEECTIIGVENTVSQSEVKTFGSSTTTTVESGVGVEVEGFGTSTSVEESVTKSWAYTYEQSWSTSMYVEYEECVKLTDEKYTYEWLWAFNVVWYGEEILVKTQSRALTENLNMQPKCYPGYMKDKVYYQECSPDFYLPGFE